MVIPEDSHTIDNTLLIHCPKCGQRFRVTDDLRNRMVECGSCEHRFRIGDDVIVQQKRIYPGERRDPLLDLLPRVPLASGHPSGGGADQFLDDTERAARFGPTPFHRIVLGVVGGVVLVSCALLMILGAHREGMLDGVSTNNRFILAGFLSLLGSAFVLYANPRSLRKALLFVVVSSAAILSLPWFFQDASSPVQGIGKASLAAVTDDGESKTAQPYDKLRDQIGDQPLVAEIKRAEQADPGGGRQVAGLWLRGLEEQYKLQIRDYIIRATGADFSSHLYPRGGGDFLMVVSGLKGGIKDLREACARFGRVERVINELQVIEVVVDNQAFVEGPFEKLTDPKDPSFYVLNKRELESVDMRRAMRAAKRLADVEPKLYRDDISKRLAELLKEGDVDILGDVAHALEVWAQPGDDRGRAMIEAINKMRVAGKVIPESMVRFLVRRKDPSVIPAIDELWLSNPTGWESLYAEMGTSAVGEGLLIKHMDDERIVIRRSAARLLGQLGTSARSAPVLEKAMAGSDSELKVICQHSLAALSARDAGAKP